MSEPTTNIPREELIEWHDESAAVAFGEDSAEAHTATSALLRADGFRIAELEAKVEQDAAKIDRLVSGLSEIASAGFKDSVALRRIALETLADTGDLAPGHAQRLLGRTNV